MKYSLQLSNAQTDSTTRIPVRDQWGFCDDQCSNKRSEMSTIKHKKKTNVIWLMNWFKSRLSRNDYYFIDPLQSIMQTHGTYLFKNPQIIFEKTARGIDTVHYNKRTLQDVQTEMVLKLIQIEKNNNNILDIWVSICTKECILGRKVSWFHKMSDLENIKIQQY